MLGQPPANVGGQVGGPLRTIEHDAVDEAHHVERRAVDIGVGAHSQRRRDGDVGATDRGDDAMLAFHVVCRGQHVTERGPPQHDPSAPAVGDGIRQVRTPAGDQRELVRGLRVGDVGFEPPRCDSVGVDALHEAPP
jgi:hypothetical protein